MYTSFYKLTDRPFQLSPDPRFFFGSRGHRKAMAYLTYGLNQGEGFIIITGDIGMGKTTLVGSILGIVPPRSGQVRFGEQDIAGRAPAANVADGSTASTGPRTRRRSSAWSDP